MKPNRILSLLVGLSLAVSPLLADDASAAKVKVPGAPTIVKITSSQVKKNVQKMTVMIEKPSVTGGAPIIDVTVEVAGKKCVVRGKASSCTIKSVPLTLNSRPTVYATARNKAGKGKRARAFYWTSIGSWLAPGFTPSGTRFPGVSYKRSNARVLVGGSVKLSKFQPFRRSNVSGASVRQIVPRVPSQTVVFNVTGVVGLGMPAIVSSAPTSGVFAVKTDGTMVDSLVPGSLQVSVRDFYSAPNGRVYVVFNSSVPIEQGGTPCALAEVNSGTGGVTCVDTALSSVAMGMIGTPGITNPPIQFDGQGNIYYTGTLNSKFALRKSVNGVVTSLINDNISLQDFLVLDDGSVLMKGSTMMPPTAWFRRLSPTSSLSNLLPSGSVPTFMTRFPDGNVYIGAPSDNMSPLGVRRYNVASGTLESKYWIAFGLGMKTTFDAYYFTNSVCPLTGSNKFCQMSSAPPSKLFVTSDNRVLAVVNRGLAQFYPNLALANTIVDSITVSQQVNNKLILAGTDSSGTNVLTVYDPSTFQETVIVDETNQVEIYSVAYIESTGKLMFNGLRFSDNQVVVGEVDMP